ncbi:23S rRNA (adenine(2503)-C(2))-methyltransferase RlmN [Verrucomicrobiaceae bacterium 227]
MSILSDLTFSQLQARLTEEGVNPANASAIFRMVHQRSVEISELGKNVQRWVVEQEILRPEVVREVASSDGYTRKFVLRFTDGREIETVLMGYEGRHTACISSQVGCAMGCVFCATGKMGFLRHLTAGEIVGQVHFLNEILAEDGKDLIRNIVMMGMGEPLHNFGPLTNALEILTDPRGPGLSPARVSISTVGHVPGIRKLAKLDQKYSLSVSLHGASDEERGALIPINKRWPIAELLGACRDYSSETGRKVFIAWTLIEGANDSDDHARRLAELLKGMEVHVNLIPLNPTEDFDGRPPSEERILAFLKIVRDTAAVPVTIRQRRGIDVGAGCGQLVI